MKHILLGVLVGLLAAFPHLAAQGAVPVETTARWLAVQPAVVAAAVAYATVLGLRRTRRRLP